MKRFVIFVIVLGFLSGLICYACVAINRDENKAPPLSKPFYTPEPTHKHTAESWARYDVPLSDELQRYTLAVCREYQVRAALVYAVMKYESNFNVGDVTDGEDYGLMQIRASVHKERCDRLGCWNLLDPKQNIRCGVDYLAELIDFGGSEEWALSWYNGHGGEPCEYSRLILAEADRLEESVMIEVE